MAYRKVSDDSLTSLADAIRAKTGGTAELEFPSGFLSAVAGIQAGSGSGSGGTAAVQIGASNVTLAVMMLISGEDGSISSFSDTSLTVPRNSVLAIYATAAGGSAKEAASVAVSSSSGAVTMMSMSSMASTVNAMIVFLVPVTGDCVIALTRYTGLDIV